MPASPDPPGLLQRVLLLERQQGYQDRAAVGGLSTFARVQVDRAGDHHGVRAAAGILQGYERADRRGRESAVTQALRVLLTNAPVETRKAPQAAPRSSASSARSTGEDIRATSVAPRRPPLRVVHAPEDLNSSVAALKGVGPATAQTLAKLGVNTVRDLLYYFPREHYDYSDTSSISRMRVGQKTTLVGTIKDVRTNYTRQRKAITTAVVEDQTGTVAVRWFNQPYIAKSLPVGARVAITGEPDLFNGFVTFHPRDYELIQDVDLVHAGRWVPVYPLTKGLYQRSLRALIRRVLDEYVDAVQEYLPETVKTRFTLPDLGYALRQFHFPDEMADKEAAQQRLAFDELLLVQMGLLRRKRQWQQSLPYVSVETDRDLLERFYRSLPFEATGAQRRVIEEILADVARPVPMSRLLQGDVGAGKTVVAAAVLLQVAAGGKQGVLMAPTEILAEQHDRTLQRLLEPFGVKSDLLVGSTPKAERRRILEGVKDGSIQVLVGTHALIQEGVEFGTLGLAITDEQHRFGVEQRATLRAKGLHPHTLAMTATPIPRSLAMTIYGDLDVSVLDEMPPGRVPVVTTWSRTADEAYGVVRDEILAGHQAFVICPVIEESADNDMRSVMAEYKDLQTAVFPELSVGLLHGRMKPREKEGTLLAFRNGEYDVLVATSVVEVGIDIPNATAMVIRDAHRFGLAQLHQFRGRVGRGGDQAYCVLLSDAEGEEARERLEAVTALDSGFDLAEEDLRLRGPGEFWGTRQSGLPELKVAQLGDVRTIERARQAAVEILRRDPELSLREHATLAERVERFWSVSSDLS